MKMHVAQQVVHSVKGLTTHLEKKGKNTLMNMDSDSMSKHVNTTLVPNLAFEWFHRQVNDHMCLECLFLDEALEADMTLEGPYAVVDQHVPLQVGRECELP